MHHYFNSPHIALICDPFTCPKLGLRLEGNREIDILAYNREQNKYLHIEVSVRIGYPFQLLDRAHKFDITNYPKRKFGDSRVKKFVEKLFCTDQYSKVLVIWDKPAKNWKKIEKIAAKQKITILFLKDMLVELMKDLKHDNRNQRDEIIRTLQLVSRFS